MKFFKKRAATAFALAVTMLATSISPVFAEGTSEMNTVPADTDATALANNPAYRSYFDWRDRNQFGMPSENVMYVYAKQGETIYFGSNVTNANDRSIQAIVEPEIGFTTTLSSDGKTWAGSSIAVTLPVSDTKAYDPTNMDVSNFAPGSEISSGVNTKVYLFKPTQNGEGHISNLEMEKNGPNGVIQSGATTVTENGYVPLSFVAPVTGTYSFRFLSEQYILSDQPISATMDPNAIETISIDFQGLGEFGVPALSTGTVTSKQTYYEDGLGYVSVNKHDNNVSINNVTEEITAESTGYKYTTDDLYMQFTRSTTGRGEIRFTPLHDNVEIEIVWKATEAAAGRRYLFKKQGDGKEDTGTTLTPNGNKLNVTKFSTINGKPIVAGEEVAIALIPRDGSDHSFSQIYEIRYNYNRTTVPKATVPPVPTASPSPTPTPTPTPTPRVTEYEIRLDDFDATDISTGTDGYVNDFTFPENDFCECTLYGNDKDRGYDVILDGSITPVEGGDTFAKYISLGYAEAEDGTDQFLGTVETEGVHDDSSARMLSITPKQDNVSVEITWSTTYQRAYLRSYMKTAEGVVEKKNWGNHLAGSLNTGTITQFTKDIPTYILFGRGNANIYKIKCIVTDEYPFEDTTTSDESATTSETASLFSYTTYENTVSVDFSRLAGKENVSYSEENYFDVNVKHGKYTITDTEMPLVYNSDNNNPGEYVAITPKHDNAWVEIVWAPYSADVRAALYYKLGTQVTLGKQYTGTEKQFTKINLSKDETTCIFFGAYGGKYFSGTIYQIIYHYPETTTHARPVSETYTWDLNYLNGTNDADGKTSAYTANAILGDGSYSYGDGVTDSDYSYEHDMKVYATADYPVTVNGGNLYIYDSSFNNDGTPLGGVLEFTPSYTGTVEVVYDRGKIKIEQGTASAGPADAAASTLTSVSMDVVAGVPVYIYPTGGSHSAYIRAIHYTVTGATGLSRKVGENAEPWSNDTGSLVAAWDITVADTATKTVKDGRVWTDILFLNAGGYKRSIYPQLNILTKEGFLYDMRLNGVQPYGFVFYSNNRGFLFDRWSLFSKPELSGETKTTERLQALEHSFYSYSDGSDVGTAPIHIEKDGNNNPIVYNGNIMQSTIDGNYIPVDAAKDATHMIFFNTPSAEALKAYTGNDTIKTISNADTDYAELLNNIEYEGLGNAKNNADDVHYGTIGIGGNFRVTITAAEAARLNALGSNSISIMLDFSGYDLDENGTAPVPVLAEDDTWAKLADASAATEAEKQNVVSLSAVIDTTATSDKVYILAWDGRDAYGNVVPQGTYSQNVKSFIEMGMAHFPILDAEHNPNGFKVTMKNSGNDKASYLYYNNEAVSPKKDSEDPSAWYFASHETEPQKYPAQIGDGQNMTGGVDTATAGAMVFGEYDEILEGSAEALQDVYDGLNKGKNGGDGGYGNYAAIDMWSKYERSAAAELSIGVNPIEKLKPYVSFVATNGSTGSTTDPFTTSHVGYAGQKIAEYPANRGESTIYGNTISTGFVAKLSTAAGVTQNYVTWDITVPVTGTFEGIANTGTDTFIKIPSTESFTTQEEVDEAEYLAYELYSGLFSDYAVADDETSVGEEEDPSWDADAALGEDGDVGIVDTATGAAGEETGITEEMYIEEMALTSEAGDYTKSEDWTVTFNVNQEATLTDDAGVKVNNGKIHQVLEIKDDTKSAVDANIKLRYKLPTTITGTGTVTVGLVIDNLYAPCATASAVYTANDLDQFHDITSTLFDFEAFDAGTTTNSVQASTFENYWQNPYNDYFTMNEDGISSVTMSGVSEFEALTYHWTTKSWSDMTNYKTVVDDVYSNDMFCFTDVDMTDMAAIYVNAGTNRNDSKLYFYAVDKSATELAAMDKTAVNALLTDDTLIAEMKLINTGGYTAYTKNATNVSNAKTGTKALIVKGTSGGYVANLDNISFAYIAR